MLKTTKNHSKFHGPTLGVTIVEEAVIPHLLATLGTLKFQRGNNVGAQNS